MRRITADIWKMFSNRLTKKNHLLHNDYIFYIKTISIYFNKKDTSPFKHLHWNGNKTHVYVLHNLCLLLKKAQILFKHLARLWKIDKHESYKIPLLLFWKPHKISKNKKLTESIFNGLEKRTVYQRIAY